MTEEFEKEIIRSVLGGNTDAFEALVTEYEAASGSEMLKQRLVGDRVYADFGDGMYLCSCSASELMSALFD